MEVTRHFTATTFIVFDNKVLLHKHKKLRRWLPVGGHIDRDELPLDAAKREVLEEAGLEVEFYQGEQKFLRTEDVKSLPVPAHLLLEDINPFHQHIDFVYFARSSSDEILPEAEEFGNLYWFSLDQLEKTEDMPEDVKILAREAVQLLGK